MLQRYTHINSWHFWSKPKTTPKFTNCFCINGKLLPWILSSIVFSLLLIDRKRDGNKSSNVISSKLWVESDLNTIFRTFSESARLMLKKFSDPKSFVSVPYLQFLGFIYTYICTNVKRSIIWHNYQPNHCKNVKNIYFLFEFIQSHICWFVSYLSKSFNSEVRHTVK